MNKGKPETINACLKNLWSAVVNDCKDIPGINVEVKKIIHAARQVGGEEFANMLDREIEKHVEGILRSVNN